MPSTVEQLSPSRVKLTVSVPFADLKPSLDKAYKEIASQVNIPGFRKGKVPSMVIDQRFGRGMVLQEAINDAVPDLYGKAVEESGVTPLGQPEIEVTKLEDNEELEFTAEVDVRPEFDVPDLSKVEVSVDNVTPDDSMIDEQIDMLRQRFGTTNDVERAAAEGDVVTIDLVATKDGESLQDATAEGITYTAGSGGMLDGLDDAIAGLSAGESKDFVSTLVGGPNKGEEVDVTVTVSKVSEQQLPEVDDDFAQLVSEFDTIDEMREDLSARVVEMAKAEQIAGARDKVLEAIIADLDFEVPEGVAKSEIETRNEQIDKQLAQAGMTLQQYLDEAEEEEATSAEEFRATMESRSNDALKAQMLLDKVADEQQIGVEQEDLTEHIFRKAQQNESSPEQEMQHMMEHNHLPEWMTEIRRGKALEYIVSQATVTDADGNVVEVAQPKVVEPELEDDADESDEDSVSGEVLQGSASEEN